MDSVVVFVYGNSYEGEYITLLFKETPTVSQIIDAVNARCDPFFANAVYRHRNKLEDVVSGFQSSFDDSTIADIEQSDYFMMKMQDVL